MINVYIFSNLVRRPHYFLVLSWGLNELKEKIVFGMLLEYKKITCSKKGRHLVYFLFFSFLWIIYVLNFFVI
jgi:hypothetical protein